MDKNKAHLFIVEDDVSMGFLLVDFFESNGFKVSLYSDGLLGWKAFESDSFDFCILDIMLPGLDGYSLAEKIRTLNTTIPIIFLTARSLKVDKLKGFNLGVDDYVTKPFDEDELLCRINAIMARTVRQSDTHNGIVINQYFQIQSYTFDHINQQLSCNNVAHRLTKKETEVLKMLCISKNQIVTRDALLNAIWGDNNYFNGRSLDVFITKLRKYLSLDPNIRIENIPTVGFVLNS